MFGLPVFVNPARFRREFLQATEVGEQYKNAELLAEFRKMGEASPDLHMGGNFWWDFIRTYPVHLSWLLFSKFLAVVAVLSIVFISQRLLADTNSVELAVGLLVAYGCIQVAMKVANAWDAYLQSQLLVMGRTFVTLRLNVKLLRMGSLASADFTTGNLKTLISSDIHRVGEFLQAMSRNALPCLLSLVLLGPVIVWYMGVPGLLALVSGFGALPLAVIIGRFVHSKETVIKEEEDRLSTLVGEWVANVRLLKFLGWETVMREQVARHVRTLVTQATLQHGSNLVNFGVSVTWWLIPIIVLVWGHQRFGDDSPLVELFASIWMLNHITLYIRWLPGIFISYAAASACVDRLNQLYRHPDIEDQLLPVCGVPESGAQPLQLIFREVSFRYPGASRAAIDDLDLVLDLNTTTSLIGSVGAGKSTFLKLVCAELKPDAGVIEVAFSDGQTYNLWARDVYHAWREWIAYMPQEAYLSNTTLAINVALEDEYDSQDAWRAIQLAELEADIALLPGGINEEVGETGVNLSGGQKQRVNLARALYSGRSFMVLDDPLSAVDTQTEARLMDSLMAGPDGFLLSSHRLSELLRTQRLIVLDDGHITEDGAPLNRAANPQSAFNRHLNAGEIEADLPR
ncbi:MAG: ABC transporter ATP-binding protein [Pseudomonadales bacterium]|nr:ABC transporter ATP-binding protein [Pseudomonadales bacterium]